MDFKYLCRTCRQQGTFRDGSPGCGKFNIKIDPNKDFCAWHENEDTPSCSFCGEHEGLYLIYLDESWHYICANHHKVLYTCQACAHNQECGFQNDHSAPPYVMRQVRQGNMVIQQQVKNPKLIARHCPTCKCSFGNNNDCFKETCSNEPGCPNWQLQTGLLL